MPLVEAEFPLRIGLADAGREGLYHLQRLGLREDCAVLAVSGAEDGRTFLPRDWAGRQHASREALFADPDLDAILLAGPPSERTGSAMAVLRAGKHLLIPAPMCLNAREAQQLLDEAGRLQRNVAILHPRRWDGDFRTVETFARTGVAGAIGAARLCERQYGRTAEPHPLPAGDLLLRFGCHSFDQLVRLVPAPVTRIFARVAGNPASASSEFTTLFEFAGGATAQVDVSLGSFAPLQTGWILDGERGGYREGVWFRATPDGEVVDVAVERHPSDLDAPYTEAIRELRSPPPVTVSAREAIRVLRLIDAARDSAATGEWVRVPAQ